jgi:2-polyprenyl-6-methoxyphenol hydroxylase-like FAD-dependent oxidoreductase
MTKQLDVAIIGAGICGLALSLNLHRRGIACRVYERVPEIKPLGVGITMLPHAMRELTALGLQEKVIASGIVNRESAFFNRFGQLIYKEPRGNFAGYDVPEVGIHRGRLHMLLVEAVRERLGGAKLLTNRECTDIAQGDMGVTLSFKESASGKPLENINADVVIACDGVNSAIRKRYYPNEKLAFAGINSWRGITRRKPIFDGHTYIRVGSIRTGKIVIYPIADNIDGEGNQLINWMADIKRDTFVQNDWNQPGKLEDFLPVYADWNFDWLDVAQLIRDSDQILEYPMVDKDPVDTWTFGRVTLAGDAAHPMYPRGSNGAAQALIDARTLADALERNPSAPEALRDYEVARVKAAANVVRTNREFPPDFINTKVEELVGDKPFDNLNSYISQDELRALSENYKRVAGFTLADVGGVRAS